MKTAAIFCLRWIHHLTRLTVWLTLILCLSALLLGLLFAHLPYYRPLIQDLLTQTTGKPIKIGELTTTWQHEMPSVSLEEITLNQHNNTKLHINDLTIALDLFTSLTQQRLILESIILNQATLQLNPPLTTQTIETKPDKPTTPPSSLTWFLQQPYIQFTQLQLQLPSANLNLNAPEIAVQKEENQHHINGTLQLPEEKLGGGKLAFTSTLTGLTTGQLTHFTAQIRFTPKNTEKNIQIAIQGTTQNDNNWLLTLQPITQQQIPPLHLQLRLQPTWQITLQTEKLNIATIYNLLTELYPSINLINPFKNLNGEITQLNATINPDTWEANIQFNALEIQNTLFHAKKLTGTLQLTEKKGQLNIQQSHLTLLAPQAYTQPLPFHTTGQLTWQTDGTSWQLQPNLHIHDTDTLRTQINIQGTTHLPTLHSPPHVDLKITIQGGHIPQVYRYIPDKLIPYTADWLQNALLAGRITKGEAHLKGTLDTLFQRPNGFRSRLHVAGVRLRYENSWKDIENITATLDFTQRQLKITATQGTLYNSRIRQVTAHIQDLAADIPILTINGDMPTTATDGLRFLRESPLRDQVNIEDTLELTGKMNVAIDLRIPLALVPNTTKGKIRFDNITLRDKFLGITLNNVSGILDFTDTFLKSEPLKARLFNQNITFSFKKMEGVDFAEVELQGRADTEFIRQQLSHVIPDWRDLPYSRWFAGATDWQATLKLPTKPHLETHIQVETDFSGMAIQLPAPLYKTTNEKRLFKLKVDLAEKDEIRLSYDAVFNGVLQLNQGILEKAHFLLGATDGSILPVETGIYITGKIPHFIFHTWKNALENVVIHSNPSNPANSSTPLWREITLQIEKLDIKSYVLQRVNLHLETTKQGWLATLKGKEIDAKIQWQQLPQHPPQLHVLLHHLTLNPQTPSQTPNNEFSKSPPIPQELPATIIECADCRIADIHLGKLWLQAQPTPEGLRFLNITVQNQSGFLRGIGQWRHQRGKHESFFSFSAQFPDIKNVFQQVGLKNIYLTGSQVSVDAEVYWQNSPLQMQLNQVEGLARLALTQGSIIDVEPGTAGRMIGLLDLFLLPRRLMFDFRDVFGEGLIFDGITGDFHLSQGNLYTQNLLLDAPAASVKMRGRIGLLAQDYDKIVIITPHVSNALPLAAGVLGGGIGAGAVALVFQKWLEKGVNQLLYYQYHITGKWNNPTIQPFIENQAMKEEKSPFTNSD